VPPSYCAGSTTVLCPTRPVPAFAGFAPALKTHCVEDRLEDGGAVIAVLELPVRPDLDLPLALVAAVGDRAADQAEGLRQAAEAGEQVVAGAVPGIGELDQGAERLAHFARDAAACLVGLCGVVRFDGELVQPLQHVADLARVVSSAPRRWRRDPSCANTASSRRAPGSGRAIARRRSDLGRLENRKPVEIWFCVRASWLCVVPRVRSQASRMEASETRMGLPPDRRDERVEERARDGDRLRRGLVGMLPAHEIGGLLVEIDARNRRNGFLRLARERRLGVAADVRLLRFTADGAHQPLNAPLIEVVPPASTFAFCKPAASSAFRLSPAPPVFFWIVKLSPVTGVPEICTRQPLTSMLPPLV